MAPRWWGKAGLYAMDGHNSHTCVKKTDLKLPRSLKTSLSATAPATATATASATAIYQTKSRQRRRINSWWRFFLPYQHVHNLFHKTCITSSKYIDWTQVHILFCTSCSVKRFFQEGFIGTKSCHPCQSCRTEASATSALQTCGPESRNRPPWLRICIVSLPDIICRVKLDQNIP
jgi:hypothetical protein